jgi:hypothetical protein
VDKEGSFYRSTQNAPHTRFWHQVEDRCDVLLGDALQTCRELTKEELHMLKSAKCKKSTNPERVRRVLYVLLRDLLASPIAGMILEKKSLRDRFFCDGTSFPAYNYHLTGPPVGPFEKLIILIILCGLVFIMLAYVLTFAALHPSQLQRAWLYSLYIWVGVDCVFISTLEVLIQQVLIPWYIKADMKTVLQLVMDLIPKYTEKVRLDNIVRTAATDPIQVHNNKPLQLPDELPEEQHLHNITDLFFVTARIAEHEHETAQARFLHFYTTMAPPGEIFTKKRWYRTLYSSLAKVTKKFKNPNIFTKTIGYGYRTVFHLDLARKIIRHALVAYIYAPVWLQDFALQFVLLIVVGVFLLVCFALYEVQPILAAVPGIILVIATVVYLFFDAIVRLLVCLWGVSNRVRPARLPSYHEETDGHEDTHRSYKSHKSHRSHHSHSHRDKSTPALPDVESTEALPGVAPDAAGPKEPVQMLPLGAQVDPAHSPDRQPKTLPQQSSPHPRKEPQFFSSESESEQDERPVRAKPGAPRTLLSVEGSDLEEEGDGYAELAIRAPKRDDTKPEREHETAPAGRAVRFVDLPEQPEGEVLQVPSDDENAAGLPPEGPFEEDPESLEEAPQAAGVGSGVSEDESESSRSRSVSETEDAPPRPVDFAGQRSMSSKAGGDAVRTGLFVGGRGGVPSPTTAAAVASPTAAPPVLRMQNLFSDSSASLHSAPAAASSLAVPMPPPAAAAALPMTLIAQSVESEEDDSDYEEYDPDDLSRESFDEPIEQMRY